MVNCMFLFFHERNPEKRPSKKRETKSLAGSHLWGSITSKNENKITWKRLEEINEEKDVIIIIIIIIIIILFTYVATKSLYRKTKDFLTEWTLNQR